MNKLAKQAMVATAMALAVSGVAQANDNDHDRKACSNATLRGDYGIQLQGTRPSSPGGPIESVIGVVIRHYDGQGRFTQVDNVKGSTSGTVPDRPGFGTYQVNADCTGVVNLQPGPGILIEERVVIVDNGNEIRSATMQPPLLMVTSTQLKI